MLRRAIWLLVAMTLLPGGIAEAAATAYTVVAGDTLSKIAGRFCGDPKVYRKIQKDNRVANPHMIFPGRELMINCEGSGTPAPSEVPETEPAPAIAPLAQSHVHIIDEVKPRRSKTRDLTPMEMAVVRTFPEEPAKMLAVIKLESSFNPEAEGFNCFYLKSTGEILTAKQGKRLPKKLRDSKACKPQHRKFAWSVDCGVAQNNRPGQKRCRPTDMDVERGLAEARNKWESDGITHWFARHNKRFKAEVAHYEKILGNAVVNTGVFAMTTPVNTTIRAHSYVRVIPERHE